MRVLYTDNIQKIKKLDLEYKLLKLEDWGGALNSIFLIYNKDFDINSILGNGFIITLFESKYSDFEITEFNTKLINKRLDYFYEMIINIDLNENKVPEITDLNENKVLDKIEKTELPKLKITNLFSGIYINNILIKNGNIRFIPIYEVILHVFKEKFTGKILISKRNSEIYSLFFFDGELTSIESLKESDNFQYFLKKYGYISKINREIYLYSIKNQLDIFIADNNVFKHEKNIIYKDYIGFLFRNIITLNNGDFEILDEIGDDIPVFSDYLGFLYNFINYLRNKKFQYHNFKITKDFINKVDNKKFNEEMLSFLIEIKNGRNKTELIKIFKEYKSKYIENMLLFFMIIAVIKDSSDENLIMLSSKSVNENISKRISIWNEKIKKENYFSLLGIDINDNDEFIEEKFRNLFSQFSNYLSSEEIRIRYRNELEDIIFELEAAYNVVKNKELKEKYYTRMLK